MRKQEEHGYQIRDYLFEAAAAASSSSHPPRPQSPRVDVACRVAMTHWAQQVGHYCHYQPETIYTAMTLLDRFLTTSIGQQVLCDHEHYQLAAMTAVYLSAKINEPCVLDVATVAAFSHGIYTPVQITAMERTMLTALAWKVHPPTPHSFVRLVLNVVLRTNTDEAAAATAPDVDVDVYVEEEEQSAAIHAISTRAFAQIDALLDEYEFCTIPASTIAWACIVNAMEDTIHDDDDVTKDQQQFEVLIGHLLHINTTTINIHELRTTIRQRCDAKVNNTTALHNYHHTKKNAGPNNKKQQIIRTDNTTTQKQLVSLANKATTHPSTAIAAASNKRATCTSSHRQQCIHTSPRTVIII